MLQVNRLITGNSEYTTVRYMLKKLKGEACMYAVYIMCTISLR